MKYCMLLSVILTLGALTTAAQDASSTSESRYDTRYSVGVIDDATFCSSLSEPAPTVLNQELLEPSFSVHLAHRWSFSTNLLEASTT